ncbi:MAG: hypothetical protein VX871_00430 [Pseudomonadota bacterium]|nr:hypothetical protein [Pseudomonadota bacterium]
MLKLLSNSLATIFVSATAYAAIPVALTFLSADGIAGFPLLLAAAMALAGIVAMPVVLREGRGAAILADRPLLVASVTQAACFVLSLYFFTLAARDGNDVMAVLLMECWPIVAAMMIGPFLARQFASLSPREGLWALVALAGVMVLITDRENMLSGRFFHRNDPASIAYALLSMFLMAASVVLKARASEILRKDHGIGPLPGFVVLQVCFAPLVPFAWALSAFGEAALLPALAGVDYLVVLAVFLLNLVSGVFFTYGTLHLQRASDTFVWFFAPAISVLMLASVRTVVPTFNELIGIALIVSSNLLMTFRADHGLSYRASLLALLASGTICAYLPGSGFNQYFDCLSVLSIFFVVLLSFMIGRFAERNGEELHLLAGLFSHVAAAKARQPALARELLRRLGQLQTARSRVVLRRRYWQSIRLLQKLKNKEMRANIKCDLDLYITSRHRGVAFGQIFALGGCVYATLLIGLFARGEGWPYDLFITVYAPSMVFAFFTLLDLQLGRVGMHFRPADFIARDVHVSRVLLGRVRPDHVAWSCMLLAFVVLVFTLIFVGYADRFPAAT